MLVGAKNSTHICRVNDSYLGTGCCKDDPGLRPDYECCMKKYSILPGCASWPDVGTAGG